MKKLGLRSILSLLGNEEWVRNEASRYAPLTFNYSTRQKSSTFTISESRALSIL